MLGLVCSVVIKSSKVVAVIGGRGIFAEARIICTWGQRVGAKAVGALESGEKKKEEGVRSSCRRVSSHMSMVQLWPSSHGAPDETQCPGATHLDEGIVRSYNKSSNNFYSAANLSIPLQYTPSLHDISTGIVTFSEERRAPHPEYILHLRVCTPVVRGRERLEIQQVFRESRFGSETNVSCRNPKEALKNAPLASRNREVQLHHSVSPTNTTACGHYDKEVSSVCKKFS